MSGLNEVQAKDLRTKALIGFYPFLNVPRCAVRLICRNRPVLHVYFFGMNSKESTIFSRSSRSLKPFLSNME